MLNYSIQDLLAVSFAFALFPLFVFVPGYMVGVTFNLLNFRDRTSLVRTLLSLPLSVSLTPVVIFILGSLSATLVWVFYAAVWSGFAVVLAVPRFPKPYGQPARKRAWVPGLVIGLGVAAVLCLSLIDWQIGDRLDLGISAYDYNFRAAVIDSISRRGVPPISPFLHPGKDVAFRYHYYWFMVCSLVDQLGGKLVTARQAQIAGTAWVGMTLCSFVAICLRFFDPKGALNIRKRTYAGLLLLLVSGLDIFPIFLKFLSSRKQPTKPVILGTAEWWSADPVTSWAHALLWVPHHVAGVIVCFTGFLLLWNLDALTPWPKRAAAWLGAALAFASATGLSIHVTFAFGCAMAVWGIVMLFERRFWRTADLAAAGLLSIAIASPFLITLVTSGEGRGSGTGTGVAGPAVAAPAFPLSFGIRQFRPLYAPLLARGISSKSLSTVDFFALPLNYLAEFGFFAVIGVLFFFRARSGDARTREYELTVASIMGTVLLICTFVRSTVIGNNDLGWRGILLAQFLLLLVAVDYVLALPAKATGGIAVRPATRIVLGCFFCIGILPSLFEVGTHRFHQLLVDRGLVAPAIDEEADLSKRAFALRGIYGKLNRALPEAALVQHNPIAFQDIPSGLYADRQRALMGDADYTSFGGNLQEQEHARVILQKMFAKQAADADFDEACKQLGLSAIVVTDADAVWRNQKSWVWNRNPLAEAPGSRALGCPALTIRP